MLSEELLTTLLIAVGLAMDCFAVSATRGLTIRAARSKTALMMALSFGAFQGVMPLLGWAAGESFIGLISGFDHWIAFCLLSIVGGKMILEAGRKDEDGPSALGIGTLLMLSVATSIDAFAVGLSIAFLGIDVYAASVIIAATSFVLSLAGFFIASRSNGRLGGKAELAGGAVLILIGLKILIEHMA